MSSSNQPNATLYVNNLNDKVQKDELKSQLYALFTTYGKIIDIVASKSPTMRGQAFLVFTDLASATSALRACEGMVFYDKPMHIDYAKTKSYATSKREDPNFVPPTSANASLFVNGKRAREEEGGEPQAKKGNADDSDEEMEIDDDEEEQGPVVDFDTSGAIPPTQSSPSVRLLCTNLPQEVTGQVLDILFQHHDGFKKTYVSPSPTPSPSGEKVKMAQVLFANTENAATAQKALNGYALKKGWQMSVAFTVT